MPETKNHSRENEDTLKTSKTEKNDTVEVEKKFKKQQDTLEKLNKQEKNGKETDDTLEEFLDSAYEQEEKSPSKKGFFDEFKTKVEERVQYVKDNAEKSEFRASVMDTLKILRIANKEARKGITEWKNGNAKELFKNLAEKIGKDVDTRQKKVIDLGLFLEYNHDEEFYKEFNEQPLTKEEWNEISEIVQEG